jgi:hypothetical protein
MTYSSAPLLVFTTLERPGPAPAPTISPAPRPADPRRRLSPATGGLRELNGAGLRLP